MIWICSIVFNGTYCWGKLKNNIYRKLFLGNFRLREKFSDRNALEMGFIVVYFYHCHCEIVSMYPFIEMQYLRIDCYHISLITNIVSSYKLHNHRPIVLYIKYRVIVNSQANQISFPCHKNNPQHSLSTVTKPLENASWLYGKLTTPSHTSHKASRHRISPFSENAPPQRHARSCDHLGCGRARGKRPKSAISQLEMSAYTSRSTHSCGSHTFSYRRMELIKPRKKIVRRCVARSASVALPLVSSHTSRHIWTFRWRCGCCCMDGVLRMEIASVPFRGIPMDGSGALPFEALWAWPFVLFARYSSGFVDGLLWTFVLGS